jgi:hypothetical protein
VTQGIPQISYWMDRPLSELPRDELEREFCAAHREIQRLNKELCDRSVAHVHDLADAARRRLYAKRPWPVRVLLDTD